MCVLWQRDSPHCPVGHTRLETRNCSGLDVRPWQQELTTLARKVKQMGRFFSFSPEDSTQLHLLPLPGERTSLEGGGVWGHLDWTGLKGQSSLHQKGTHPGNPTQFAAVFGLSDAKSVAVAAFLDGGVGAGGVRAPLRAANAAEAFVCFPRRMSVKGSLIFIHIL